MYFIENVVPCALPRYENIESCFGAQELINIDRIIKIKRGFIWHYLEELLNKKVTFPFFRRGLKFSEDSMGLCMRLSGKIPENMQWFLQIE